MSNKQYYNSCNRKNKVSFLRLIVTHLQQYLVYKASPRWNSCEKIEAVIRRCSAKKMLLKISQNSQENTCARGLQHLRPATLLKKRLWHRCLPVNSEKFLRTPFLTEHLRSLLLKRYGQSCNLIYCFKIA